jgi:glycine/D-amino acid oxidase-like deaminating enzyme
MGVTSALELGRRGWQVSLLDAGAIPHPLAASTDISKVCRMEYGADEFYMRLMEEARAGWLAWNEAWRAQGRDTLYHETGVLMVCLDVMATGGFEHESFATLERRGHKPERIGGAELIERFPAWSERFVDGFFHAVGGWAESGRVVRALVGTARQQGIEVLESERVASLVESAGAVTGVVTESGKRIEAEAVVLAGGSWLAEGELIPELADCFRRTYHPVWHLRPRQPERFVADRFPVFTADIARTGFYGFPLHPREGVVKMGHHGLGVAVEETARAAGELTVPERVTEKLRAFLSENLPSLADAEVVATRLCPYCDTADEDLWIAAHPHRPGLTVAAGGSGHGFKFGPVLGPIIADAVEGKKNRVSEKFRWRPEVRMARGLEAARCHQEVF